MALLKIWRKQPKEILSFSIQQILAMAGDGKLRDGSTCSHELRTVLSEAPTDFLRRSARFCLESAFPDSGLVLQDIINEVGRRLEFKVEHGLYRGTKLRAGFDGCWKAPKCRDMIIEVKTTDYINISIQRLHDYRRALTKDGAVDEDACFLIVLGREDAGALEDQVRGSRYGWDTRLISVEALLKLLDVKEFADKESTISQIRALLQPLQTTKLDGIIDIVFSTATDVETTDDPPTRSIRDPNGKKGKFKQTRTPLQDIEAKRGLAAESFGKGMKMRFVRHRRTLYRGGDEDVRLCVVVSKSYGNDNQPYWYAYHPHWDEFLRGGKSAFLILTCMDRSVAYAIPYGKFSPLLPMLSKTGAGGRTYWHLSITKLDSGELAINLTSAGEKVLLKPFEFALQS